MATINLILQSIKKSVGGIGFIHQTLRLSAMTLGDKQRKFTKMIAELILFAYDQGYEITLGHALRCDCCPVGRKQSNHKQKLAMDLNLFKGGAYLTETEDHQFLGEKWESMGGDWGGHFQDANHYSLEHQGRR